MSKILKTRWPAEFTDMAWYNSETRERQCNGMTHSFCNWHHLKFVINSLVLLLKFFLCPSSHLGTRQHLQFWVDSGGLTGVLSVQVTIFLVLFRTINIYFFYKNNGKTWLSVLILEVITYHLSCYSEMFE